MYITQQDILGMRVAHEGTLSDGEILRELIDAYKGSAEYKAAKTAARYFRGRHDIYDYDFRTEAVCEDVITKKGVPEEQWRPFVNENRSNFRAANAFFREHITQKVAYMLGREPSVTVVGAGESAELDAYSEALAETTDAAFNREIKRWASKASIGGKAWLHEYKDRDGVLRQTVVSAENGLPVYDPAYEAELMEFIYFYDITQRTGRRTTKKRTCAEWWTAEHVTYWHADDGGVFTPDRERPGKQPHFWSKTMRAGADGVTMQEVSRSGMSFGRLPWIELRNNEDGASDLNAYKDLIDAYDLVQNMGTNTLMDFNEFWAVVQGFGGENAAAIVRKLRTNRAVSVGSAGAHGNVELKQLALDMGGRIDWLRVLREAIYEFGMAVDVKAAQNLGSAPSGFSLKFQYTLLDLKASDMMSEMAPALERHFWFVTQELNRQRGASYDAGLVDISFNRSMIVNESEVVSMIVASDGLVPDRLLLAAHPLVTDADAAMAEMERQRAQKAKEAAAAFGRIGGDDA